LAGVGVTWYTMLENGSADGVSGATLEAIASALRLDASEADYLRRLADARESVPPHAHADELTLGALSAIEWAPAYICTSQWTALAWNRAMSLVWNLEEPGAAPFNIAVRMFTDPRMRALHGSRFEQFAAGLVAMLRSGAGQRSDDPAYHRIYEALCEDPVFSAAWNAYTIATPLGSIATTIDSPAIGLFVYNALTLPVPGDAGHSIVVQVPDVPSAERLRAALVRRSQL